MIFLLVIFKASLAILIVVFFCSVKEKPKETYAEKLCYAATVRLIFLSLIQCYEVRILALVVD